MTENNLLIKENIKYIIIHCSDTEDSDTAADIHQLHLSFGWDGIGYHKIIQRDGKVENGRPEYWIGAHARGYNTKSLGVCLIGKKKFTKNQFNSLEKIIRLWKSCYNNPKIIGHNLISDTNKTCPNFDVEQWCRIKNL